MARNNSNKLNLQNDEESLKIVIKKKSLLISIRYLGEPFSLF